MKMNEENKNLVNDLEPITNTLNKIGRIDVAKQVLDAFSNISSIFQHYDNLAKCYFKLKCYKEAIDNAEKALLYCLSNELSEQAYVTRWNMINIYNHWNYPEKSLYYIEQNEKVIPFDVDVQLEKAYALYISNKKTEAEKILRTVLNSPYTPEHYKQKIKFNLGTYHLLRDDFQTGLKLMINEGKKIGIWNTIKPHPKLIEWDGLSKPYEKIVVYAEAGIGDEIINVRFMKHLKDMDMEPYWYDEFNSRPDLQKVFERNGFNVVRNIEDLPLNKGIYYAYSIHLPIDLKLQYKDLWYGPYLKADKEHSLKWKKLINNHNKLKIGIRWQGNPGYEFDSMRTVPIEQLYNYLKDYNCKLYSLQKDIDPKFYEDKRIIDTGSLLNTWDDTLSLIDNLDLVITSCTSVAHAAAAMGKKVFIFVPIYSYYVWCHSTEKSPWYGDNVTLLRQTTPRSWDEPIEQLKQYLQQINN